MSAGLHSRNLTFGIKFYRINPRSISSFPGGAQCILLVNCVHSVACSALIVNGWVMLAWIRKSCLGPTEIMYMCDSPIETVECIWVNIWCMLNWIWSQNSRNTLLLHTAFNLTKLLNKLLNKLLKCCKKLYLLM